MIGVGVLIFNPFDDPFHLERVETGLKSLVEAALHSRTKVELLFLLNTSFAQGTIIPGVGPVTEALVKKLAKKHEFITVESYSYSESMMVKGYNYILKKLHKSKKYSYASVFADDYIVPIDWFNTVIEEFCLFKDADFVMPSTSFVTHKNLLVPLGKHANWDYDVREETVVGVKSGVEQKHITDLAARFKTWRTIKYVHSPSFETTVFTADCLSRFGYLCDEYYSVFYNTEYFRNLVHRRANGYISRRAFVFHYGKGGTAALYKDKGDEKYEGSPAEEFLKRDVALFNLRNNEQVGFWWKNENNGNSPQLTDEDIIAIVEGFDRQDRQNRVERKLRNIFGRFVKWITKKS
ncbi:hypothetical protein [Halodesulfovibrio sp.]|uniref:hypothetical protein n=1 Tax=Halodesulfovibrio sp. TaxID=1912772 RepID=UPI0025B96472|nr:hypothetical protein [Halodesulfovibrio sp.]